MDRNNRNPRDLRLDSFDFELPERLIALRPASPRGSARLLVANSDGLSDSAFARLPDWLRRGDRLVLNDTRVIPARLFGTRRRAAEPGPTEARIEVTLLAPERDGAARSGPEDLSGTRQGAGPESGLRALPEPEAGAPRAWGLRWRALVRPLRKVKVGDRLEFPGGLGASLAAVGDGQAVLEFEPGADGFEAALERAGTTPLPPYIASRRETDGRDRDDYQSVWARRPGSVAAPTASLHFDQAMLAELERSGIGLSRVTLHVGAGTFLPVKSEDVRDHRMHAEFGRLDERACAEIRRTREAGGRIVPVGTTALRVIETAAAKSGPGRDIEPWEGLTDIFVYPGFEFRATDALITNFHLPKSTLFMLVAALMGRERMLDAYAHAIERGYRFLSYGDASLLVPSGR